MLVTELDTICGSGPQGPTLVWHHLPASPAPYSESNLLGSTRQALALPFGLSQGSIDVHIGMTSYKVLKEAGDRPLLNDKDCANR